MIPRNRRSGAHDEHTGVLPPTDRHDEYATDPGNLNR
ncbi:hypothetical protein SAMN05216207_1009143 [Pseudonocardia ammonioxydans]|uniref:Uncharacterized protein n=1 Tax=Pseudonocardia ammonioxydans TaxID=260086 RepID=A0A1I4WWH5_PSUAM|nr:hypothetical protein SAMN05216207_1009143 [Pseudonocardia ammonioxydans]